MGVDVKEELHDAMINAIVKYKEAIASMFPNMETANPDMQSGGRSKIKLGYAFAHNHKRVRKH